jgi:hypothetical protein
MLEAVSEVALRTPELRRSLPPGYAHADFDRAGARTQLQRLAALLAKEVELDPALDLMADTFIRSRAGDNRTAVRDASKPIAMTDRFKARPLTPYRIAEEDEHIVVIGPGGELKFSAGLRSAVERALSGTPFVPGDLPGANDPASLAARLFAYGLIVKL